MPRLATGCIIGPMTFQHRTARLLVASFLALAALGEAAGIAAGADPVDYLPDLRMAPPARFHIETLSVSGRVLRFDAFIRNTGRGRFEVRASRTSTAQTLMTAKQRVYNSAGGWNDYPTAAVAKYTGDGHNHWHMQKVATYELRRAGSPTILRSGSKVGFCFFDTNNPVPSSVYTGPRYARHYVESSCGVRESLKVYMGITPGWSDLYPWDFRYQWVKIGGLPSGTYVLKLKVDTQHYYRESNTANNCSFARIRLSSVYSTVTVLTTGTDCTVTAAL